MKPMLAVQYDKSRVNFPCICQPKYDGVRALVFEDENGEIHIHSRNEKEYNIPHIKRWAELHKWLLPLDGEIYNHRDLTFQQICSAVKCESEMTQKLKMVVYDKPTGGDMSSRLVNMEVGLGNIKDGPIYLSEWKVCYSEKDITDYHKECVGRGFEGVIVRNYNGHYTSDRNKDLMKLKIFDTNEFEIKNVIEASGRDKGTAIFVLSANGFTFNARPCGSQECRRKYLNEKDNIIGKLCTVKHQGFTDGGIPRFPVALTIRDYE